MNGNLIRCSGYFEESCISHFLRGIIQNKFIWETLVETTMGNHKEDKISIIMNDGNRVREIIQEGIRQALLNHKRAWNPICEWKNNKVVWISPDKILISNDE